MLTINRVHLLTATPQVFQSLADHNNLTWSFGTKDVVSHLSQIPVRKAVQWSIIRYAYNYKGHHISKDENFRADLHGRWTVPVIRWLVTIRSLPSKTGPDFNWPSISSYRGIQNVAHLFTSCHLHHISWYTINNLIWIFDVVSEFQLSVCIIAHCEPADHRGFSTTLLHVPDTTYCIIIESDVTYLVCWSIYCLATTGGDMVPCPYGPAITGKSQDSLL